MPRSTSLAPKRDRKRKTSQWWISIPPKLSETGKRQKRFFKTKELAVGEAQRIKVRQENHGIAAKILGPAEEQQSASALKLLRDGGVETQLTEIVSQYLEVNHQRNKSVALLYAWEHYERRRDKRFSVTHLKNLSWTKLKLSPLHGTLLSDLTTSQINDCFAGHSPTYRNALIRITRAVLNWSMKGDRKWLKHNPADDCEFDLEEPLGEPEIYTPDNIRRLIHATVNIEPRLVSTMALMTFAGIRPDQSDGEIVRIEWKDINLVDDHRRIELPALASKTRKNRTILVRPALESWLTWHHRNIGNSQGLICPHKGSALRRKIRSVFQTAGVTRIQDGLRHSFASYLAALEDLDTVEKELGHTGGRTVLEKHYRKNVQKVDALKFWAICAPMPAPTKKRALTPKRVAAKKSPPSRKK